MAHLYGRAHAAEVARAARRLAQLNAEADLRKADDVGGSDPMLARGLRERARAAMRAAMTPDEKRAARWALLERLDDTGDPTERAALQARADEYLEPDPYVPTEGDLADAAEMIAKADAVRHDPTAAAGYRARAADYLAGRG